MSLKKYNEKRDFSKTNEPKGKITKSSKKLKFVIQYHRARADHYDFRLEHNGILLSWAVPKGLSLNPKVKRLAVMVEDHPLDYSNFEGIIPKGNYGAGTVEIFDNGNYIAKYNIEQGLKKGHVKIILNGKKLKGAFSLIKIDEKSWIIIKEQDEFASVKEKVAIKAKNPFKNCSPMMATLSEKVPCEKNWIYEIKYDGYRLMSFIENNKVKLLSRNGVDYSNKFKNITAKLVQLAKGTPMILDGEVVCFDETGESDFGLLQKNIKTRTYDFLYVVFDVLAFNGIDLRDDPLLKRKDTLTKILTKPPNNIIESSFVNQNGKECFNLAKKLGLEGIVAKDINSVYNQGRSDKWLKIKCYKRQEFVIGGFTKSEKNSILSALLVGFYDGDEFKYVGKVGTGFSEELKKDLTKKFKPLIQNASSFLNPPKENNVTWLKPKFIAEVQFAELTKDNLLRQASFIGLREDKLPTEVNLEISKK